MDRRLQNNLELDKINIDSMGSTEEEEGSWALEILDEFNSMSSLPDDDVVIMEQQTEQVFMQTPPYVSAQVAYSSGLRRLKGQEHLP